MKWRVSLLLLDGFAGSGLRAIKAWNYIFLVGIELVLLKGTPVFLVGDTSGKREFGAKIPSQHYTIPLSHSFESPVYWSCLRFYL